MKTPNLLEELTQTSLNTAGRRNFLCKLGLATAGTAGLLGASRATAVEALPAPTDTDVAVLNFALNLEYLEAEYYLHATTGSGLKNSDANGSGGEDAGDVFVKANSKVKFDTPAFEDYANEIAIDEKAHVQFIRAALDANGAAYVSRPQINLKKSFETLGELVGVKNFDPFANEINFLLGAFIFEDVGVTAYKGASPLITDKGILEAAAGILGVEAYHAGVVRTLLYAQGGAIQNLVNKISAVRASLDNRPANAGRLDQGIVRKGKANLVPTDGNSIAFSRSTRQVLNIVYGGVDADSGLFFPKGLNGAIA